MSSAPSRISQPPPSRVVGTGDSYFSSVNLNTALALLAAAASGVAATLAYQTFTSSPSTSTSLRGSSQPFSPPPSSAVPRRSAMSSSKSHSAPSFSKKPLVVTITGAAGQIGYSIIFMVAAGRMLGEDQPIELRLLDMSVNTTALPPPPTPVLQ